MARIARDADSSGINGKRIGNTLKSRYLIDNFICGMLVMYLFVYAAELYILLPCGSFHDIANCDLPPASMAFWRAYFELDPLFLQMPAWLVVVMSIQDFLFNPWWLLSLFMFWTGRQEANWYKTLTLLVCGTIIATTSLTFGVQMMHPHYTPRVMAMLTMINGPWIAGPLLIAWRLRHSDADTAQSYRKTGAAALGIIMLVAPTVLYFMMSAIRRMI